MLANQRLGVGRRGQKSARQEDFYRKQTIAQLKEKVGKLSAQQIEVSEKREQVLIDRQTFIQSTARVHEQMSKSANAAAALMDAFRKYYNELGTPMPKELVGAYTHLDEEKDKLGSLGAELSQTEDDLGALEWNFAELENDLYSYDLQQLLSDEVPDDIGEEIQEQVHTEPGISSPVSVSAAFQYQAVITEYSRLVHHYKIMREDVAARLIDASTLSIDETELLELANSGFVQSFSITLNQIADCEVKLQNLKGELISYQDTPDIKVRRLSEPAPWTGALSVVSDMTSCVHSEGAVSKLADHFPAARRVREWLLDCLKENALEKTQYLNILQQTLAHIDIQELDFTQWEIRTTQQWPFYMIEPPRVIMNTSTQETTQVDVMGETHRIIDQTHDIEHQVSLGHKSQSFGSNLFDNLIKDCTPDEDNRPKPYSGSETSSSKESLASADIHDSIRSTCSSIDTITRSTLGCTTSHSARGKEPGETGMEKMHHISLSPENLNCKRDKTPNDLCEPTSALGNFDKTSQGMILTVSPSSGLSDSVYTSLAVPERYRCSSPAETESFIRDSEPRLSESSYSLKQLKDMSLSPDEEAGYQLNQSIDGILHCNHEAEFHRQYKSAAAPKQVAFCVEERIFSLLWSNKADKLLSSQFQLSQRTQLSQYEETCSYNKYTVVLRYREEFYQCISLQPHHYPNTHGLKQDTSHTIAYGPECPPKLSPSHSSPELLLLWIAEAISLPANRSSSQEKMNFRTLICLRNARRSSDLAHK